MAKIFPSLEEIARSNQQRTKGEWHIIKFLCENLPDHDEIYFEPFINGDKPDVVVVRPAVSVLIIEVKDWYLPSYQIDEHGSWRLLNENIKLKKSPLEQVKNYKDNFYNLHINSLQERNIKNRSYYGLIKCAVYFHSHTSKEIQDFIKSDPLSSKYIELIGNDNLKEKTFNHLLNRGQIKLDDDLYRSFKRYLQPPLHTKEQANPVPLTTQQKRLSESRLGYPVSKKSKTSRQQQKIKGVAGSGKTLVLANRAVNALKQIERQRKIYSPPVLILTFNLTLVHYIHDCISNVREDFAWQNFEIINYHRFIKGKIDKLGISPQQYQNYDFFDNIDLFEGYKNKIFKYSVILIDEIQDYKREWVEIIRTYFLHPPGEFVVFGDEKQNIYNRTMDEEKKPYTGIGGNWNILKHSSRLSPSLAALATKFQNEFFSRKYEIETVETVTQLNLLDETESKERIEYFPMQNDCVSLFEFISQKIKNLGIHNSDVSIQAAEVKTVRKIDLCTRIIHEFKTTTMFETHELYYYLLFERYKDNFKIKPYFSKFCCTDKENIDVSKLLAYLDIDHDKAKAELQQELDKYNLSLEQLKQLKKNLLYLLQESKNKKDQDWKNIVSELEHIRRSKKISFYMGTGCIKLSTIHSFKGWEINTLFLIIEPETQKNQINDELIYTALTRCRRNLFILDCDQKRYRQFFESVLQQNFNK